MTAQVYHTVSVKSPMQTGPPSDRLQRLPGVSIFQGSSHIMPGLSMMSCLSLGKTCVKRNAVHQRGSRKGEIATEYERQKVENIGARGLEPPTSASRTLRATKLRYAPNAQIHITLFGLREQLNNHLTLVTIAPQTEPPSIASATGSILRAAGSR